MAQKRINPQLTIDFEETGEGENVVLIPGLGNRKSVWIDVVNSLRTEFRVLTYELRCYSGEAPEGQFTIQELADDLMSLLDSLGTKRTHVVGHSEGGFIALELALARPDLVSSLVVGASAAYTDNYGRHLLRNWRRILEEQNIEDFLEDLFLWNYSPEFFNDRPRELRVLKHWALGSSFDAVSYLRHNFACEAHETRDRLGQISCPTLLIGGAQDIVMGIRHNLLLKTLIPHAELIIIQKAAHHLFAENPRESHPPLRDFLIRQAKRTTAGSSR